MVYLTTEEKYKKFTQKDHTNTSKKKSDEDVVSEEEKTIRSMSIFQRWGFYLFRREN